MFLNNVTTDGWVSCGLMLVMLLETYPATMNSGENWHYFWTLG